MISPSSARAAEATDGSGSVVVEYWQSANRVFYAACGHCGWSGDIVISTAAGVEGFEPEH